MMEEIRVTCAKIANKNIKVKHSREEKQHFFEHNFHSWQVFDSSLESQGGGNGKIRDYDLNKRCLVFFIKIWQ